jgi:integrase
MASIQKMANGRYRARYRDGSNKEHLKRFALKRDAQRWLDQETARLQSGSWVAPRTAKTTVQQWCQTWLANQEGKRPNTVRMARVYVGKITEEFGHRRLDSIQPMEIQAWINRLRSEGVADSYLYLLHTKFAQIYRDAIHNGRVVRSPLSRHTSPPKGRQRQYVATTAQVWALHDAMEPRYRAGLLLGAFSGLRVSEVCGLRVSDVNFLRREVHPTVQYPADELKSETSRSPIPIPQWMVDELAAHVEQFSTTHIMCTETGQQMGPWQLELAFKAAKSAVEGLPEGFRFHDLRHFYASFLIDAGLDIKTVQTRLRHASAQTTLDTYGHMLPDRDETTRAALDAALEGRSGNPAAISRPANAVVKSVS